MHMILCDRAAYETELPAKSGSTAVRARGRYRFLILGDECAGNDSARIQARAIAALMGLHV